MPLTPDELLARLDALGLVTETRRHDPIFTVEQGQAIWAAIPGAHCKNLFLKDDHGALFLLVALEQAVVRVNRLHKVAGCRRLSFGSPELLFEVLGVTPGSVTPFALVNDPGHRVTVLLDADLLRQPVLNFHPLANDRTTTITREDFCRFLDATGHTRHTIDLAELAG